MIPPGQTRMRLVSNKAQMDDNKNETEEQITVTCPE